LAWRWARDSRRSKPGTIGRDLPCASSWDQRFGKAKSFHHRAIQRKHLPRVATSCMFNGRPVSIHAEMYDFETRNSPHVKIRVLVAGASNPCGCPPSWRWLKAAQFPGRIPAAYPPGGRGSNVRSRAISPRLIRMDITLRNLRSIRLGSSCAKLFNSIFRRCSIPSASRQPVAAARKFRHE